MVLVTFNPYVAIGACILLHRCTVYPVDLKWRRIVTKAFVTLPKYMCTKMLKNNFRYIY